MTQTEQELVTDEVKDKVTSVLNDMGVVKPVFEITEGAVKGDNYLGIVARTDVRGEKDGQKVTLHLIIKSAPRAGIIRQMSFLDIAYSREIYMYSTVLPEFLKLQEERGVADGFRAIAKYYGSSLNEFNEFLVLENMKVVGYQLFDRHKSMNYEHTSMVIKEYGKYHALSFALRDQKPEVFGKLSENVVDCIFDKMLTDEIVDSIKTQTNRVLLALDPVEDKEACDRFKIFQENVFDLITSAVKPEPAGQHAVIGHGDCWVNNMLFKYGDPDKPNKPTSLCLLDWQLSRIGSPALDLSYFLFTCTDKALRDEHYEDLLKEYHKSLSDHLKQLGSDPEKLFPFDVLQSHMKKFSVYGLYMSIMVLHFMTSESEEIPDIHQITSLEEAKDQFEYVSKNVDKYNSRVKGVILDFVRLGYDF